MMKIPVAWCMRLRGWRPYTGITITPDGPRVSGRILWDIFGRQWLKEKTVE